MGTGCSRRETERNTTGINAAGPLKSGETSKSKSLSGSGSKDFGPATGMRLVPIPVRLRVLFQSIPVPISIAISRKEEGVAVLDRCVQAIDSFLARRSEKAMIPANQAMHPRPLDGRYESLDRRPLVIAVGLFLKHHRSPCFSQRRKERKVWEDCRCGNTDPTIL